MASPIQITVTEDSIDEKEKVIVVRFDGQLDESPLTLREIHKIEQTITRMLQGLFHTRISYPSREETTGGMA